jgi:multiple sugar transport system permease protein
VYGLVISLFDTNLLNKWQFVGLDNYASIISDSQLWSSLGITIVFSLGSVLLQVVLGFSCALMVNSEKLYGRGILRALLLIPWVMPSVVAGLVWRWIYNTMYGLLNSLLLSLGIIDYGLSWLGEPSLALTSVTVAYAWKCFPFCMLMFLAGLQSVPKDLYEAAQTDGAKPWEIFFHVTLPYISNITVTTSLLTFFRSFKEFNMIFVMTGGGPANATDVLSTHVRRVAFDQYRFGYGSALAIVILLILLVTSTITKRKTQTDWQ